ncbi:DUF5916 domain-containing protein [candidate division KSB1 bacterium]
MNRRIILVFCVLSIFIYGISFPQENVKSVTAVRTGTPEIDGLFNDYEWVKGGKAEGFVQMEPVEGEPSTERTEAYFLYDDENLYVGIKCYAKEPDKIVKQITGRDNQGSADWLEIHLDTFHDHRNAYLFVTTPGSAKCDGKYSEDGFTEDWSWDGVWWVKTSVTDFGWVAEYKIPFSTLKFPKKENHTWGLNILRWISNKNEWTSWQPCKRDDRIKMSKDGHLEGLAGIKTGMNLELLPYFTSMAQKDRISSLKLKNENGITGFDVNYGLTSNLTAVLTVNPDFAQIEADEDLINLTRYPLYLPEKRPFFTEGSSIFHTAGNFPNSKLFYSRRISEPVYGLKMTGKIGNWNLGVIHSLNDNDFGVKTKIENNEISENTKHQAFYNVIRMRKDVFSRSEVGFITMSKEYSGGYNRIIGFDGTFRFKDNYIFFIEGVKSYSPDVKKDNYSLLTELFYSTDLFSYTIDYLQQASDFIGNELGIYNYNNYRRAQISFGYSPRLEKIGIRQLNISNSIMGENFWDNKFFDKEKLSRSWSTFISLTSMNYWRFMFGSNFGKRYDRFDEILYPSDSYQFNITNNHTSRINLSLSHTQGKYRTGYSWSYNSAARLRSTDRLNVEFSYNKSLAKLINPNTEKMDKHFYEVWRTKFHYSFNRDLNARLIFQYSGLEKRLDTYYLIAFNFKPKSFLYIAYTERFDETSYTGIDGSEIFPRFGSSNKILQVKLSNLFMW